MERQSAVPALTTLTAHAILQKLDKTNLHLLFSVATKIYKLKYKRMTWNEDNYNWSTLAEKGIIGTYLTKKALDKAKKEHFEQLSSVWMATPNPRNRRQEQPTFDASKSRLQLCDCDDKHSYAMEEVHYTVTNLFTL